MHFSNTERVQAMYHLKHMTRDGSFTLWDEYFNPLLFILVETLAGDECADIKSASLRALKELW